MFMTVVVAYPFKAVRVYERAPEADSSLETDGDSGGQATIMDLPSSNRTESFRSLQQLFEGNQKYRQGARMSSEKVSEQDPGFMFLGCLDNKLTPSTIFNAPTGSIVTHNNIGNQYSKKDTGAGISSGTTYHCSRTLWLPRCGKRHHQPPESQQGGSEMDQTDCGYVRICEKNGDCQTSQFQDAKTWSAKWDHRCAPFERYWIPRSGRRKR